MQKFHFLVRFTKLGRVRFLSHRELMTIWGQAVRRAAIPIAFSEGFNPRPRISFPSALRLGIESEDEVLFLHLAQWMRPDEIIQRLSDQLIDGIKVTKVEPVASNQIPTCFEVTYKITWHRTTRPNAEIIKNLLDQSEIFIVRSKPAPSRPARRFTMAGGSAPLRDGPVSLRDRRDSFGNVSKRINIRPYLKEISIKDNEFTLVAKVTPQGTLRPDEVISVLGLDGSMAQGDFSIRKLRTELKI